MCTCQADLCNKDFFDAGYNNGTEPGEELKVIRYRYWYRNCYIVFTQCYVCKPGEKINAPCDEFEAGELQQCPEDTNSGCLISKLTVGDSPGLYTRSCSGSHAFPCRDYDGDQEDSVRSHSYCLIMEICCFSSSMSVSVKAMAVTRTGPLQGTNLPIQPHQLLVACSALNATR